MSIQAGQVFGEYTVQRKSTASTKKHSKYECLCSCGKEKTVFGFCLTDGSSWHCGCKASEIRKQIWDRKSEDEKMRWLAACNNNKHMLHKSKAYAAWSSMKQRCTNPKSNWYPSYGGRGITVCDSWLKSFEAFLADMGEPPHKTRQLGRIDNDLGYFKENCRWETPSENQRNKSNAAFVDSPVGRIHLKEAVKQYGLSDGCIKYRIQAGWPIEKVFLKPSQRSDHGQTKA